MVAAVAQSSEGGLGWRGGGRVTSCQICEWNTFTDGSADFMQVCLCMRLLVW